MSGFWRWAISSWLLAVPALAQLDSAALRAKYGAPLNRGTFRVRPGLDLAVDYGLHGQVCAMEFPELPENEKQELLTQVAPESTRGKELNRLMANMGLAWLSTVEYEHVTIVDQGHGQTHTSTMVRFKIEGCR